MQQLSSVWSSSHGSLVLLSEHGKCLIAFGLEFDVVVRVFTAFGKCLRGTFFQRALDAACLRLVNPEMLTQKTMRCVIAPVVWFRRHALAAILKFVNPWARVGDHGLSEQIECFEHAALLAFGLANFVIACRPVLLCQNRAANVVNQGCVKFVVDVALIGDGEKLIEASVMLFGAACGFVVFVNHLTQGSLPVLESASVLPPRVTIGGFERETDGATFVWIVFFASDQ
jgi:hypothetical protein